MDIVVSNIEYTYDFHRVALHFHCSFVPLLLLGYVIHVDIGI